MSLTDEQAAALFDGLIQVLTDRGPNAELDGLVADVRAAIAQGRPSGAEVSLPTVGRARRKERVRIVEPLNSVERLSLLVHAIELALVTPVDVAQSALNSLAADDHENVALAFEQDSAALEQIGAQVTGTAITISRTDIQLARDAVAPLREALSVIRGELES